MTSKWNVCDLAHLGMNMATSWIVNICIKLSTRNIIVFSQTVLYQRNKRNHRKKAWSILLHWNFKLLRQSKELHIKDLHIKGAEGSNSEYNSQRCNKMNITPKLFSSDLPPKIKYICQPPGTFLTFAIVSKGSITKFPINCTGQSPI